MCEKSILEVIDSIAKNGDYVVSIPTAKNFMIVQIPSARLDDPIDLRLRQRFKWMSENVVAPRPYFDKNEDPSLFRDDIQFAHVGIIYVLRKDLVPFFDQIRFRRFFAFYALCILIQNQFSGKKFLINVRL